MPCDFELIEVYRNVCQGTTSLDDAILQNDQLVPQSHNIFHDATQLSTATFALKPENFQGSTTSDIPAILLAPSAGCTTVTEVPDQQLNTGNSPSHITNLDLYACSDATMYDVATDSKVADFQWDLKGVQDEAFDEEVNDVLYHLATKDILNECQSLNISKDPTQWSTEDVAKWITHTCNKFQIAEVNLEMFHMNGKCLCLLSEDDFLWRTEDGSHLYSQLEIWKNFYKIEFEQGESCLEQRHYHDTTMVDATSFETYSLPPASPGGCSLDSLSSTAGSSPGSAKPLEDYLIPSKIKVEDPPCRPTEHKQTIHLWQFLKELLLKPESFSGCIKWIDRSRGIFKIEDSGRVAKEWGRRKNRPAMNYDKLSRSIRQYYKKGIIKKTEHSKRLVYQFCAPYL